MECMCMMQGSLRGKNEFSHPKQIFLVKWLWISYLIVSTIEMLTTATQDSSVCTYSQWKKVFIGLCAVLWKGKYTAIQSHVEPPLEAISWSNHFLYVCIRASHHCGIILTHSSLPLIEVYKHSLHYKHSSLKVLSQYFSRWYLDF